MSRLKFDESNEIDQPGKFMLLSKFEIRVDHTYQRPEKSRYAINEIAKEFSWKSFGTLAVADRNGRFYVFDGQHRLKAALRLPTITKVPCMVFTVEGMHEEAKGFCRMNITRSPVRSIDHFRASLAAGDSEAIELDILLKDLGIKLVPYVKQYSEMQCIGMIRQHFATDPIRTERSLRACLRLTRSGDEPLFESLVSGMFYLDGCISSDQGVNDPRFLRKLDSLGGQKVLESINRAKAYYVRGGAKVFAQGILDAVNHGLHKRFEASGIQSI